MKISFLVLMIIVFSKEIAQFDNNYQSSIHNCIEKNQCQILSDFNLIEESVTLQYFTRQIIFEKQQQECKSEYDYRNYQIQDANFILKRSIFIYQQCDKKLNNNQIKEKILNQQKMNSEAFKLILNSISSKENVLYNNTLRQFQVAIQLIHTLIRQINQINETEQLIFQIVNFMHEVLLSKIIGSVTNQFYSLFQILVELGNQQSFDNTFFKSEVLNILNKLLSYLENQIDILLFKYKIKCNDFATQQQRIEQILIQLQFRIDMLEKNVRSASNCINSYITIQNAASAKLIKNQLILEKMQKFCQTSKKQHDDALGIKENFNKLVNQIKGIVKQRQIKK